ncbi:lysoplasmalogenase [bacterium]|nr:lysoplasmalogenase [bacterium]
MNPLTKKANRILTIIFLGFGIAYLMTLSYRPYPLCFMVKSIPIFCLSLFVLLNIPGKKGKLLFLGFLFSAFGDVFLSLQPKVFFEVGMGAFTIAHLFYITVFLRKPLLNAKRGAALGIVILYSAIYGVILYPNLGSMMIPIYIYLGVISIMAISACLGRYNHPLIIAGAYLFIISDSIIAYSMFISRFDLSSLSVMITYYSAQLLIAYGCFLSREE